MVIDKVSKIEKLFDTLMNELKHYIYAQKIVQTKVQHGHENTKQTEFNQNVVLLMDQQKLEYQIYIDTTLDQ